MMKDSVSFIIPPSYVSHTPSLTVGLPLCIHAAACG
jgi:hypothetical protein